MKSDMHENESSLVPLHYSPYISLINEILQKKSLFSIPSKHVLQIAAADIAQQVAQEFRKREGTSHELPALFAYTLGTRAATVHLDSEQAVNEMGKAVETLRKTISTQLAETIEASTLPTGAPQEYVEGLPFPIESVQGKVPTGLHYPFLDAQKLNKRRIHLQSRNTRSAASLTRYRGHKLTIVLEGIEDFENDLIAGFLTLLQGQGATPDEIAEVQPFLEQSQQDPISELARLKKLIKEETLGKIKVAVCWWFWDEVVKAMEQDPAASADKQAGMKEMRRQLRMLDRFRHVLQDPSWADTDFQVSYAGEELICVPSLRVLRDTMYFPLAQKQ